MAFDESKESKGKGQKIIEFDCRGLEFTEFKADVRSSLSGYKYLLLTHEVHRENGRQQA